MSRRDRATANRWHLELALLAPAMAGGLGLARLTDAPTASRVMLPITACVIGGQMVAGAARRLGAVCSLAAGTLTVALVSVWCLEPSSTTWGVPTAATGRAVGHLLSSAASVINGSTTPVDAIPAVVFPAALSAGLAAVLARTVFGPIGAWRAPSRRKPPGHLRVALTLSPSAALFCYASLLSSGSDRTQAAAAYVVAATVFVLVADHSAGADASRKELVSGGRRPPMWLSSPAGPGGVACVVAAAAVTVAAGPALAGLHLSAFAASPQAVRMASSWAPPLGSGGVDSLALVDNLGAVIAGGSHDVMFTAHSAYPTYWQLTTLTAFDGQSWYPEPAILAATDGVTPPPTSSLPSLGGTVQSPTFEASVTLANLKGTLLPVPPDTSSARGRGAAMVPGIGFYRPAGAAAGVVYDVQAALPTSASGSRLRRPSAQELRPYLQLPSMPQEVVDLAHRIVEGARSSRVKAVDLLRWFDDGKFRYSLTSSDSGGDPLETFLFSSRVGFCQQFAGAYAALARIDGLPTRVAVGFDAGLPIGPGRYQVTGSDAHVWPEVYLGPGSGWVSFEPTPAVASAVEASAVVYGSTPGATHRGSSPDPNGDSVGLSRSRGAGPPEPAATSPGGRSYEATSSIRPGVTANPLPWIMVGGVFLVGSVLGRRRLWAMAEGIRCRALTPRRAVVLRWRQVDRALERRSLGRRPQETLGEHCRRVTASLDGGGVCYRELVSMAERAGFSPDPVVGTDAGRARSLSHQLRAELRRRRPRVGGGDDWR